MCPCSLLLFVHIWKYFNSYMQCCFQHLVYKIRIKMGKFSVIWRSHTHAHVYISKNWHRLAASKTPYRVNFYPPCLYYFTNSNYGWRTYQDLVHCSHAVMQLFHGMIPDLFLFTPISPMLSQKLNLLPFNT